MQSLWDDLEAAQYPGDLGQRVYSSRLLGRSPDLVLHGGGNTSVKIVERNLIGEDEEVLYVKGSGWDLEHIEADGFAPVRMARLLALARLDALSDPEMVNQLRTQLTTASAPTPSVEAILHAILPYRYVDHTHADAILSITNTPGGLQHIRRIYGNEVVVVPYVMPGFDLARTCAREFPVQAGPDTLGMVLMCHGIFTFGSTARESYERMIELVTRAEDYLRRHDAWAPPVSALEVPETRLREDVAELRAAVSVAAGFAAIVTVRRDADTLAFARDPDCSTLSQQGPATPDHVIRTKRVPLLGREVGSYVAQYGRYFETHAARSGGSKQMLDPAPRVVLDPELGLCSIGRSATDAAVVQDIYLHTMDVIRRAAALEAYVALPAGDIFAVEYWDLEQAKLKRTARPPQFLGEIALVTGAASGIGRACVESLLRRGAAVIGLDIDATIKASAERRDFLGLHCDITDRAQLEVALEAGVRRFGGIDMLVLNAGIFTAGTAIAELALEEWRRVMDVNLDANLVLLREAHPLLRRAPHGGRVVVIGSKNVPAPGRGAAAYSASKAALNQLARVVALEWGAEGIRINSLHPDAVFDTGIWTDEVLQARAAHYGLSVEEYRTRNVLRVPVRSRDVAELAAELCGPLFAKTTGAQIPVDGGNERVI